MSQRSEKLHRQVAQLRADVDALQVAWLSQQHCDAVELAAAAERTRQAHRRASEAQRTARAWKLNAILTLILAALIAGVALVISAKATTTEPATPSAVISPLDNGRLPGDDTPANTAAALGFCDGAIVDQKAMKDMADVWSAEDHCKIPFIEFYGYDIQGAIYQAIEGNMLPFVLAVGTKEESPDLGALYIADEDLAAKLAEVEDRAPRYQAIKEGRIQPTRCEHCDYCKGTKHLTAILNYKELAADAWE